MIQLKHFEGLFACLIGLLFACTSGAELDKAPGQAAQKGKDPPTRQDYEQSLLQKMDVIGNFGTDPGLRTKALYALAAWHGDAAQVLRLLCWVALPEPYLRKELLTQYLCDKKPRPSIEETRARFLKLAANRTSEARAARSLEIDEVFKDLPGELNKRRTEDVPYFARNPDGSKALFLFTEEYFLNPDQAKRSEAFKKYMALCTFDCRQIALLREEDLFCDSAEERRRAFEALPRSIPNNVCDDFRAQTVYLFLWLFEPDAVTRGMLARRLVESFDLGSQKRVTSKRWDILFTEFPAEEREKRRMAIGPDIPWTPFPEPKFTEALGVILKRYGMESALKPVIGVLNLDLNALANDAPGLVTPNLTGNDIRSVRIAKAGMIEFAPKSHQLTRYLYQPGRTPGPPEEAAPAKDITTKEQALQLAKDLFEALGITVDIGKITVEFMPMGDPPLASSRWSIVVPRTYQGVPCARNVFVNVMGYPARILAFSDCLLPESMAVSVSKEDAFSSAIAFLTERGYAAVEGSTRTASLLIVQPNNVWTRSEKEPPVLERTGMLCWDVQIECALHDRAVTPTVLVDAGTGEIVGGAEDIPQRQGIVEPRPSWP